MTVNNRTQPDTITTCLQRAIQMMAKDRSCGNTLHGDSQRRLLSAVARGLVVTALPVIVPFEGHCTVAPARCFCATCCTLLHMVFTSGRDPSLQLSVGV